MLTYATNLTEAMTRLAKDPSVVFLGQSVEYPGTAITNTLTGVPRNQLLELPVAEEMQMGMAIGMSLAGYLPVCLYPRWNFLLLAINQLVNHLDKLPLMSSYRPKVILRTSIGSVRPLHPSFQHVGDYTEALAEMCDTVKIVKLIDPEEILPAYEWASRAKGSTLLVEYGDYHNEK